MSPEERARYLSLGLVGNNARLYYDSPEYHAAIKMLVELIPEFMAVVEGRAAAGIKARTQMTEMLNLGLLDANQCIGNPDVGTEPGRYED